MKTGLCLLKRTELKIPCTYKEANQITTILESTNYFKKEKFFNEYEKINLINIVFDKPQALDKDIYFRQTYNRARLRAYTSKDKVSNFFGEWRNKKNTFVKKERKELKNWTQVSKFVEEVYSIGLVLNNISCYERTALNSTDGKVRITIDKKINYFNRKGENYTQQIFKNKDTAIIKIKIGGKPTNWFKKIVLLFTKNGAN